MDDEAGAERAERLEAQKVAEELRLKTNAEVNMKFQEVMAEEVRFIMHSIYVSVLYPRYFLFFFVFHSSR